ncbi:hypothetical protein [uncultured Mediterranean phage]|nr:hypothetical protein [uncultured Mediterranean phage]
MALVDEVATRFSTELRRQMTRNDDTTNSIDTAKLQILCDDAEEEFEVLVGVEYDNDDRRHIVAILDLVKLKAWEYGATADISAEKLQDRVRQKLEDLGRVTARDRVAPKSQSQLEPSEEVTDNRTVKPHFDSEFFEDIIPDEPTTGAPGSID